MRRTPPCSPRSGLNNSRPNIINSRLPNKRIINNRPNNITSSNNMASSNNMVSSSITNNQDSKASNNNHITNKAEGEASSARST